MSSESKYANIHGLLNTSYINVSFHPPISFSLSLTLIFFFFFGLTDLTFFPFFSFIFSITVYLLNPTNTSVEEFELGNIVQLRPLENYLRIGRETWLPAFAWAVLCPSAFHPHLGLVEFHSSCACLNILSSK